MATLTAPFAACWITSADSTKWARYIHPLTRTDKSVHVCVRVRTERDRDSNLREQHIASDTSTGGGCYVLSIL